MLGDQIYAHKPPFDTLEFIKERLGKEDPPGEVVADFEEYARIYRDASGQKGEPSSTILSGDVHLGYLAEATLAGSVKSRPYQAVCSPLRNALPSKKSYLHSHAWSKSATLAAPPDPPRRRPH